MNETPIEDAAMHWSADSYSVFAKQYLPMAARVVQSVQLEDGDSVLDIGTGTGNVALTAAQQGGSVTGIDISESMLDHARQTASQIGYDDVSWQCEDAAGLSIDRNQFDVTLSSLGHIYGQPAEDVASELRRVTKPAGRIGLTCWTPSSVYPVVAGHVMAHLDPAEQPSFSTPPFMWGDQHFVSDTLGGTEIDLTFSREVLHYPTLGPAHFWEELATFSGQLGQFLEKIENRSQLREQVIDAIRPYYDADRNVVELEYLLTTGRIAEN